MKKREVFISASKTILTAKIINCHRRDHLQFQKTKLLLTKHQVVLYTPGLLNRRPGGPALCWVLAFSTTSHLQTGLVSINDWISCAFSYRAEITVMQFTGHSLPMHQCVTVPWDYNPVPYCQPSAPTPMEDALLPSLECPVWPGRRSIYNSWRAIISTLSFYNSFTCKPFQTKSRPILTIWK